MNPSRKLKSLMYLTVAGYGAFSGFSIYKGEEKFYRNYLMPVVRLLDPENAHDFAIFLSKYQLIPKSQYIDPGLLKVKLFGMEFSNPVGIAAGFDKDGKAILGLKDIGFGFVEIGSVTPEPQPGNEQPRIFRLSSDFAVINSPNMPGLRTLQNKNILKELLCTLVEVRDNLVTDKKPPLLLKLAPDLNYKERKEIADIINQKECRVDGLIICNTTVKRPTWLKTVAMKNEKGGLSGKPLKDMSTKK